MSEVIVDIRRNQRATQRNLRLDKGTRDAMADYWRLRWPTNTAKNGAREFDLTVDQGRSVVAGRASITTLDHIEKVGGWPVILAVKAMVLGYGIDQHIIEMRKAHEDRGRRLASVFGDWLPLPDHGRSDRADAVRPLVGVRRSVGDRDGQSQG